MRIKQEYKLRKMCDSYVVVSVGSTADTFNGVVTLNSSGELLWNLLYNGATEDDLAAALVEKYGIDEQTARNDSQEFLSKVKGAGFIEQ